MPNSVVRNCDSASVFTISPQSQPNMCLDLEQMMDLSLLQLWECNGLESQLWYSDPGSYKIQWAADRSVCLDAGTMTPGTQLILWDCNGLEQQVWGYDSTGGTVCLAQSQSDASLCMDLSGGSYDLGTPVQIWSCNGYANQQWGLSSGITMRLGVDYKKCFDLAGGNTNNGATVQVWDLRQLADQACLRFVQVPGLWWFECREPARVVGLQRLRPADLRLRLRYADHLPRTELGRRLPVRRPQRWFQR